MNRQVAVLLLAVAAAGFAREPGFEEYRAVQESLAPVHDAELDLRNAGLTLGYW